MRTVIVLDDFVRDAGIGLASSQVIRGAERAAAQGLTQMLMVRIVSFISKPYCLDPSARGSPHRDEASGARRNSQTGRRDPADGVTNAVHPIRLFACGSADVNQPPLSGLSADSL